MTFSRPSFANVCGSTMSAVPSQLLATNSTDFVPGATGGPSCAAALAGSGEQGGREGGGEGSHRAVTHGGAIVVRRPARMRRLALAARGSSSVTSASMSVAPSARATDTRWWPSRT